MSGFEMGKNIDRKYFVRESKPWPSHRHKKFPFLLCTSLEIETKLTRLQITILTIKVIVRMIRRLNEATPKCIIK